ncbi:hypothetical protein SDC9_09245 [bioreactor metagenome]|uniref:Uncharacterized protein n=2 Tax=root TaxID=1 RepID=A0A098AWQ3_DESHA|nr:Hypothetical protein DPCES_0670 [Desulfitobacterium hafniense]
MTGVKMTQAKMIEVKENGGEEVNDDFKSQ